MAVLTPKRLDQRQAGTTDTTHYTAPSTAGNYAIVREIVIANTTTASAKFSISLCASGATVGDSNRIAKDEVIAANTTVIFSLNSVLGASGFISCKSDTASALTITISGVEFA